MWSWLVNLVRRLSSPAPLPPPAPAGVTIELPTIGKLLLAAGGIAEAAAFAAPWQYRELCESLAPGGMIDAALLQALATHESGNDPTIVSGANQNGTRDYGLFQINSDNFTRYGLTFANYTDPQVNGQAAVAELQRHEPDATSLGDLVSMYNAGERSGGGARKNSDGTYVNQAYVRAVLGWYLLFRVAEFAPVKKSGVASA